MNIIEQNKEKINGILSTFDRMLVNGYILQLQNSRQFLFYLTQNNRPVRKAVVQKLTEMWYHLYKDKIGGTDDICVVNFNRYFSWNFFRWNYSN